VTAPRSDANRAGDLDNDSPSVELRLDDPLATQRQRRASRGEHRTERHCHAASVTPAEQSRETRPRGTSSRTVTEPLRIAAFAFGWTRDTGIIRDVRNVARSIWASVQGDPVFMRRVNGWLTIFWIAMIPISIITGWIN